MASQQSIAPKADQPRASTESLKRTESPANLQYRVSGIKSFNARQPRKEGRALGRG
jgi:hypothetical protein